MVQSRGKRPRRVSRSAVSSSGGGPVEIASTMSGAKKASGEQASDVAVVHLGMASDHGRVALDASSANQRRARATA
jgi:hypothetical protein